MRSIKILIAVLFLFVLTSCGEDKLQGRVSDKDVDPGYTFLINIPITSTSCSGNPVVCTTDTSGYVPIYYFVPTCYKIVVKGATSGDTCVSEAAWKDIQIGDDYVGKDVDPKDRKSKA